jgi:hypothetical protein
MTVMVELWIFSFPPEATWWPKREGDWKEAFLNLFEASKFICTYQRGKGRGKSSYSPPTWLRKGIKGQKGEREAC